MSYIKNNILYISLFVFIFSIAFSLSYNALGSTAMPVNSCYWCNTGTCTPQSGGSGWTVCEDASPGGEYCGLGGESCYSTDPGSD